MFFPKLEHPEQHLKSVQETRKIKAKPKTGK